jgi:hypothetical protein
MHELQAIIASREAAEDLRRCWPTHRASALSHGLSLIPLDAEFLQQLGANDFRVPDLEDPAVRSELVKHLEPVVVPLCRASIRGRLGVVLTQYFGGAGSQAAVLIERSEIALGPLVGAESINRVLAALGVRSEGPARDEFEAVGLHRVRRHDQM